MTDVIYGGILVLVCLLLIWLVHLMTMARNTPWYSYGNEPDPLCEDCEGSGIINTVPSITDDDRTLCDCLCTVRVYY